MLPIPEFDVVLFDVGGTLLHVADDPLVTAIASVAHIGEIDMAAFRAGVDAAVSEWRANGGKPEHEDLTVTWVHHFARALSLSGFEGPIDQVARQIEDAFLADGW
jgi:FMN phosphatase YigB (HAD superfamily)